jgi:Na+-transporting methylmalonyl-CoA/oxaloacetate decarboxylase gamma subunit
MKKIISIFILALVFLSTGIQAHAQLTTSFPGNEVSLTNLNTNERIIHYKIHDSTGIGMAATTMVIVFAALFVLYLLFMLMGNSADSLTSKRVMKSSGISKEEAKSIARQSGDVYAAIAMAIYEITELHHDEEHTILTIKNTVRNYSPWSSKIYTLRESPKR